MPHVRVGDHELWVHAQGTGSPILFLHGLFFDGRIFEHQTETLHHRFRTLNVDVRDHGRSVGPEERWTLEEAAEDVVDVMDELETGPCHVVGLSMGGMIALRLALAQPDRVRSLALLDTNAGVEIERSLHVAMAWTVRLAGALGVRALMPYAAGQMFSQGFRSEPEAQEWIDRVRSKDPGEIFRGAMAVFTRTSVLERIHEIEHPTLVLVGEEDRATPPRHSKDIAQGIPNARLVTVPGAGHMTTIEQPEDVTEHLDSFVRRVESGLLEKAELV